MDRVTTVRKHLKYEHWKSIITECRSNSMTVTACVRLMTSVSRLITET